MAKDLLGKVVVITGAGSGIGKATAVEFGRQGSKVVVGDLNTRSAEMTVSEIKSDGGEAVFVMVDVRDASSVQAMCQAAVDTYGSLDCAFNNAGIEGASAPTDQYSIDDWDHVISINLTGVWLCTKHELLIMEKQQSGSIVNMSSILGKVGFESAPAYVAAKHGVIGVTQTAAIEYAAKNIRVNAICPGFIATPMLERAGITTNPEAEQAIASRHPMNRLGRPEEVAYFVAWLSSDEASFITGAAMDIDGGYLAR